MRRLSLEAVGVSLVVLLLAGSLPAAQAKPAVAGAAEVTIKGVMMCEVCCTRDLAGETEKEAEKTLVLFALEATPEVAAAWDGIMKEYYPGDGRQETRPQCHGPQCLFLCHHPRRSRRRERDGLLAHEIPRGRRCHAGRDRRNGEGGKKITRSTVFEIPKEDLARTCQRRR